MKSTRQEVYISESVDSQLYDKFFDRSDSDKLSRVRNADPSTLNATENIFSDSDLIN